MTATIYRNGVMVMMKRISFLILLLLAIVVSACATKYICQDGSVVSKQELCPQVQKQPYLPAEIKEVLDRSTKVGSMHYLYKRFDKPLERAIDVWVKGKYVKQELMVQREVLHQNEMDVIIFDIENKTAEAYCESRKFCIKTGAIGAVDFDRYYLKTPLDWIDGVTSVEKISEARISNRDVWQLRIDENTSLWVDTFFGVPLRVDAGDERHEFQNIAFNSVVDSEVQFVELKDDLG